MLTTHKKSLSLLLAALMLLSLLPVSALAEEEPLPEEPATAAAEKTIEPEPLDGEAPAEEPAEAVLPEGGDARREAGPDTAEDAADPIPEKPEPVVIGGWIEKPEPFDWEDYKDCPELTEEPVHIVYDGTAVSGALLFRAPDSREYTFLSEGNFDTRAEAYAADGTYLGFDDNSGAGYNFALTLRMEEGEECVLLTRCLGGGYDIKTDLRSGKYEYDVSYRACPKLTELTVTASEDPLIIGIDDGRWDKESAETPFYVFSDRSLCRVLTITGAYDDGSRRTMTPEEVTLKADQSTWTPGGENLLTVTAAGITQSVRIAVAAFADQYAGCPALELDVPCAVAYSGSSASGLLTFTPAEDGDYCFYSRDNRSDPCARLLTADGQELAANDDSADLDHINFLILQTLKAGQTAVLSTGTSDGAPGPYSVVVSRSMPEAGGGYASLNGVDLTGKAINLVFVVDTTGSMSDEIAGVRSNLRDFVTAIAGTGAVLRIALVDYRDITCGEDTTLHYAKSGMIWYENSDVEELRDEIGRLTATGGGDTPESVVDALGFAVEEEYMMFNSTAAKFAFLLTDADYKEQNIHGLSGMGELIERLQKKDIAVSVVTDPRMYYDCYKPLAARTGGILMDIYGGFSAAMGAFAASIAEGAADYVPDESIVPVTGVSLGNDLTVPLGKLKNFTAYITPTVATDKRLRWEVEDESIVAISELTAGHRLVVRGVSLGTTRITVRSYDGGYVDSFEMTVKEIVDEGGLVEATDPTRILDYMDDMAKAAAAAPGAAPDAYDRAYVYDVSAAEGTVPEETQSDILARIAGTGSSFTFVFENEIGDMISSWMFRGAEIGDPKITVDMGIACGGAPAVPVLLPEGDYEVVDLAHKGALPGTAHIRLRVDLPDGVYDLLLADRAAGSLTPAGKTVVADGMAEFSLERGGQVILAKFNGGAVLLLGDVDRNGAVNAADARQLLAGTEAENGDVNGDEAMDAQDAALILQFAVGQIDAFRPTAEETP